MEPGQRVTTAEFKINFFAAVTGGEMIGEGRVAHAGKRLVVADMEVKSQDGNLIAKGMATYVIIEASKSKGG